MGLEPASGARCLGEGDRSGTRVVTTEGMACVTSADDDREFIRIRTDVVVSSSDCIDFTTVACAAAVWFTSAICLSAV